jgi:hypothetical protein
MRIRARGSQSNAEAAERIQLCDLRVLCVLFVIAVAGAACSRTSAWFRQYEYEEEVYLSLDGTATVYVNSSIPALNALRGTSFDTSPNARVDRDAIRAYYAQSPSVHVPRVTTSRRSGRRFVHVRADVDDIRRLGEVAPFAWSSYEFQKVGNLFVYRQAIGAASGRDVGHVGWTGREIVAFRLHLPSKITGNNSGSEVKRGNIVAWEQPLADRLRGSPLALEAQMETQSILHRTLWLFAATFIAVAVAFGLVIWWVLRRGGPEEAIVGPGSSVPPVVR